MAAYDIDDIFIGSNSDEDIKYNSDEDAVPNLINVDAYKLLVLILGILSFWLYCMPYVICYIMKHLVVVVNTCIFMEYVIMEYAGIQLFVIILAVLLDMLYNYNVELYKLVGSIYLGVMLGLVLGLVTGLVTK